MSTNAKTNQGKTNNTNSKTKKNIVNWGLILLIVLIELGVILLICRIFCETGKEEISIYNKLATTLIIGWIGILIGYYAWAIYFYNINLGLTDLDWKKIEEKQKNNIYVEERDENPHKGETLGLPPGTVRGTLTLSLVIGALAMVISSFGKSDTLPANQVFVDNWEFFKTAFLMMIAFYFGSKSLEKINARGTFKTGKKEDENIDQENDTEVVNFNERE